MHEFGPWGDVHVEIRRPGNFLVRIGQTTSERRDRFAVAHGIGHYVLHYLYRGENQYVEFAHTGDEQAEIEANVFAAALLMPAAHFTTAWTALHGDLWVLSRRFDVSPLAVQARAEVLGLAPVGS
jgi:Zn-dependent peptidase ImmA (M78 family)